MRVCIALVPILATSIVAADPDPQPPPPEAAPLPPPPPAPAPAAPAPAPEAPPPAAPAPAPPAAAPAPPASGLPPITITITNNNNGNNSNTVTQSNNAPVTVSTPVTVAAPSLTPPAFAPRGVVEHYELRRGAPPARWLTVGAVLGKDGEARASIDLFSFHRIALGVAGQIDAPDRHHMHHGSGGASGEAYLAWTGKLGPLDVRAEIGAGIGGARTSRDRGGLSMRGDHDGAPGGATARTTGGTTTQPMPGPDGRRDGHGPELAPHAQAALLLGLPIGQKLGIVAGPEVSSDLDRHGGAEVAVFAGLRYSL